ncbi:phosphotransferase KptA/Tpt1 [Aulographum hederae CBS 113979]|uniref:2'-phosphotransferase n=1 Tax=Aulographum hederae CBS 113979 TaxID=1176131 RepID=A0A6G1GX29_9PEZI|nr:phosphotransferase KptA/Tpt1 [Aulographum hederae CBS 113979]
MASSSRGRGRGGRSRQNMPREVEVSKKLSWLLRHGAEKEKLVLRKGGWATVEDVLNTRAIKSLKITFDEIKSVVESNDKQRYSIIPISALEDVSKSSDPASQDEGPSVIFEPDSSDSSNPADFLIRANQGHSLKVDSSDLLKPITLEDPDNLPDMVVHGTTLAAWPSILKSGGLKRMTRNHVHFAAGLPAGFTTMEDADSAEKENEKKRQPVVISGMRNSSSVLIFIDIRKALDAGLPFWRSDNGVVLSEGNEDGIMPVEFFKRVEKRAKRKEGPGVLVKDGVVVE